MADKYYSTIEAVFECGEVVRFKNSLEALVIVRIDASITQKTSYNTVNNTVIYYVRNTNGNVTGAFEHELEAYPETKEGGA